MKSPIDSIKQIFPSECHERLFMVGGCVRDLLLNRSNSDIDLISTMTSDEIISYGFHLVTGKSTAPTWFRHDDAIGSIEVTLITAADELKSDLARRDFTINAMAMTLSGDIIIDPLNGRTDLNQQLLRACSMQSFNTDPLRIFRALRFEADGWKMTPDTEKLILKQDWSQSWSAIPIERFSREMLKALQLKEPERFFQRMLKLGIGAGYLPELFRMPAIPAGPLIHHPEGDLFTHSCQVLQRVSKVCDDPLTRFCALFHDLGKLGTAPALYPKHHGHDQTGFIMAQEFCRRLRLPAEYAKALAWISRLHGTFNLWDQLRDTTKLRVAEQAIKAGIVDVLPCVATADKAGGSEPEEWRKILVVAALSATALGINLQQLDGIKPSKRPAYILQARIDQLQITRTTST